MTDSMVSPFSKNHECVKCGLLSSNTIIRYVKARINEICLVNGEPIYLEGRDIKEALLKKCEHCGYEWLEEVYLKDD